jgi:hypothetical protein
MISMKWPVEEEELDVLSNDGCLQSEAIKSSTIPGLEYRLEIYPNGDNEERRNQPWIFLVLHFDKTKAINVIFTITINSASYEETTAYTFDDPTESYGFQICTRDELFDLEKKYFVDGTMNIEVEATFKSYELKPKASEILSQLLWEDDDGKDVTIECEKQELKIHKSVLTSRSLVFKAALKKCWEESKENKITITDFSYETVKIAIEFCYEQYNDDDITESNASELLHFADKYDIKGFQTWLEEVLIKEVSEANVCKLANASVTSNANELREWCIWFLMSFSGELTSIDELETLDDEIFNEMGRRSVLSRKAV